MISDPAEVICEAIAGALNALLGITNPADPNYNLFDFNFNAEIPDDIRAEAEREQPDLRVFVSPHREEGTHFDRGGAFNENIIVALLLMKRLDKDRRKLNSFAYAVKHWLRHQNLHELQTLAAITKTSPNYYYAAESTLVKSTPASFEQTSLLNHWVSLTEIAYNATKA